MLDPFAAREETDRIMEEAAAAARPGPERRRATRRLALLAGGELRAPERTARARRQLATGLLASTRTIAAGDAARHQRRAIGARPLGQRPLGLDWPLAKWS